MFLVCWFIEFRVVKWFFIVYGKGMKSIVCGCKVREFNIDSGMWIIGDIWKIVERLLYRLFEWNGIKIFCDRGYFIGVWFCWSEIYYNYFGGGVLGMLRIFFIVFG